MRNLMFVALAATGLIAANGCCGSAFRVCDGPCGGGNDPCTWYPGKCLFEKAGCNSGCGKYYWSDWHSEPPDCCDPCDRCGNYAGRYYEGNCGGCGTCGGCGDGWGGDYGGWTGGYTTGRAGGGGCNCGSGGGGSMMPAAEGDVIYETGAMRPRLSPTPMTPTPAAGPTRATATRPKASQAFAPRMRPTQASAPRVRYNGTTTTARQQDQRRVRPASHVTSANTTTSNSSWEEAQAVQQATTAPAERPCTSCRR